MTTAPAPVKHGTLIEALIAAQSEFPGIPKEASGQARGGRYQYATLPAVLDAVVPTLNRHGVALIQRTATEGDGLTLHTILRHTSGEEIVSVVPLPIPASWQDWGSALTYARRYSITALAGVAPDDDDDGATAQGAPKVEAPHGICADHGVPYFQTPRMRNPAHKLDGGRMCDKPDLGWNAPPPAAVAPAPARMPDAKAAAQAAATAGFGAPKMPAAAVAALLGVCEVHKVPWYRPRTGGAPGHYFTPVPPRPDGTRAWCHQSKPKDAPSLAQVAAEVAAARHAQVDDKEGEGEYREV